MGCTSPTTEGNLEVGGDLQPNTSQLEAVYGHSLIINPYQGMYQEIHPCMAGSIDSVKINTSLLMMREWSIFAANLSIFAAIFSVVFLHFVHIYSFSAGGCGVTIHQLLQATLIFFTEISLKHFVPTNTIEQYWGS